MKMFSTFVVVSAIFVAPVMAENTGDFNYLNQYFASQRPYIAPTAYIDNADKQTVELSKDESIQVNKLPVKQLNIQALSKRPYTE